MYVNQSILGPSEVCHVSGLSYPLSVNRLTPDGDVSSSTLLGTLAHDRLHAGFGSSSLRMSEYRDMQFTPSHRFTARHNVPSIQPESLQLRDYSDMEIDRYCLLLATLPVKSPAGLVTAPSLMMRTIPNSFINSRTPVQST